MSRSRRGARRPGARVRAFYALEPPAEVADALAAWGTRAVTGRRDWRATPVERLHVTVGFLGDRPAEEVERLADALRGAAAPWVPLAVAGAALLADGRVLAADLADPDGAFAALGRDVARAAGLAPPRRPRPHVSVARGDAGRPPPAAPPPPAEAWTADRLVLVRSVLGPDGPRYTSLAATR